MNVTSSSTPKKRHKANADLQREISWCLRKRPPWLYCKQSNPEIIVKRPHSCLHTRNTAAGHRSFAAAQLQRASTAFPPVAAAWSLRWHRLKRFDRLMLGHVIETVCSIETRAVSPPVDNHAPLAKTFRRPTWSLFRQSPPFERHDYHHHPWMGINST